LQRDRDKDGDRDEGKLAMSVDAILGAGKTLVYRKFCLNLGL